MALIKRYKLLASLQTASFSQKSQVYLFFGERFLCKQGVDLLLQRLLENDPGVVHKIDGDSEDPSQTIARLTSFSLLPGKQIYWVSDSRIFHSKTMVAEIWNKAELAFQAERYSVARRYLQSMLLAVGFKTKGTSSLTDIGPQDWRKLFAFEKPSKDISWTDEFLDKSQEITKTGKANLIDHYIDTLNKGLPTNNILILTTETVNKRQRFFTFIKKNGVIIDCSVAKGSSIAAKKEQKSILQEIMTKTLANFGKTLEPKAVELFFARVGFHPMAVVVEMEKLAHYVGDRPLITINDLKEMVPRKREDALYELTNAFASKKIDKTLMTLSHLLGQGIHPLAILAIMRNYLRKQLIYRSLQLQPSPAWHRGMNAKEFSDHYLPNLKAQGEWPELLQGHPYALFINFTEAANSTCQSLKRWLTMLLEAEFRLKGSPLPQQLVMEELFLAILLDPIKTHNGNESMVY